MGPTGELIVGLVVVVSVAVFGSVVGYWLHKGSA